MSGEALLRAINEYPRDDTPRLMYADWLDEPDDESPPNPALATYIRDSIAAERFDDHIMRAQLHGNANASALPVIPPGDERLPAGVTLSSRRGMWDGASVTAAFFLSPAFDQLRAHFPIIHVGITDEITDQNAAAIIEKLHRLEIENVTFDHLSEVNRRNVVTQLFNTSHADHLKELTIGENSHFGQHPEGMSAFETAAPHLKNLRHLGLASAGIGTSEASCQSFHNALEHLTGLRSLVLDGNGLGSGGLFVPSTDIARLLDPAKNLVSLSLLNNSFNIIDAPFLDYFIHQRQATLRSVDLRGQELAEAIPPAARSSRANELLPNAIYAYPNVSLPTLRLAGYEEDQVMKRVSKDPKNDTLRQEQAQWLEDQGLTRRAEYMRDSINAEGEEDHIKRGEMHVAAQKRAHYPSYHRIDEASGVMVECRRGLYDWADVEADFLLSPEFDSLRTRYPIVGVTVSGLNPDNAAAVAQRLDTLGIDAINVQMNDVDFDDRAATIRALLDTQHSHHLTSLRIAIPNEIKPMMAFEKASPHLLNLRHLDASYSSMGSKMDVIPSLIDRFGNALKHMPELRSLELACNHLGAGVGFSYLGRAITQLTHLKSIGFRACELGVFDLVNLNRIAKALPELTSMDLDANNRLQTQSWAAFDVAKELASCPHLLRDNLRLVGLEKVQEEVRAKTRSSGGRDPDHDPNKPKEKWRNLLQENEGRFDGMKLQREPGWPKRF